MSRDRMDDAIDVEKRVEPYEIFSTVYDQYMTHVPFEAWVRYLIARAQEFFGEIPGSVCDLACGTGRMLEHLSAYVRDCYGMDGSAAMIDVSKRRVAKGRFRLGRLEGPLPFKKESLSWIICCHDSLNYLIETDQLEGHFAAVADVLKEGGMYSVDFVTLSNILQHFHGKTRSYRFADVKMKWSNDYNRRTRIMYSRLAFQTPAGRYYEDHYQRYYSIDEIENSAKRAGLHLFLTEGNYSPKQITPSDLLMNLHFVKGN